MSRMRYFIPGRVELIGKHVDYAGGSSLTCAIDRGLTVAVEALDAPLLRLRSSARLDAVEIPYSASLPGRDDHWSCYANAVVRRLTRDFPSVQRGVEIAITSSLPESAGLSSSSAMTVAIARALVDANQLTQDSAWVRRIPDSLAEAEYFAAMETGAPFRDFAGDAGVGVAGGAQDHLAILCAKTNHCGYFGYLPARCHDYLQWPADTVLAVAVSGVTATKTGNARAHYNRTADSLRALLQAWNLRHGVNHPTLRDVVASAPEAVDGLRSLAKIGGFGVDSNYLVGRLEQFIIETQVLVPEAVRALGLGDWVAFGRLVARSQDLAETGLQNQVAETIALVHSAQSLGSIAASAFGAGFGGAVWSMVHDTEAEPFLLQWSESYRRRYPEHHASSEFFLTRPSRAATAIDSVIRPTQRSI